MKPGDIVQVFEIFPHTSGVGLWQNIVIDEERYIGVKNQVARVHSAEIAFVVSVIRDDHNKWAVALVLLSSGIVGWMSTLYLCEC